MYLTYRGVPYQLSTPTIPTTSGNVIGKYRGAMLKAQHYSASPYLQHHLNLKYRGAPYRPVVHELGEINFVTICWIQETHSELELASG